MDIFSPTSSLEVTIVDVDVTVKHAWEPIPVTAAEGRRAAVVEALSAPGSQLRQAHAPHNLPTTIKHGHHR